MTATNDFFHLHLGNRSKDELGEAERLVLERTKERRTVATDINAQLIAQASLGDRIADAIARVGGSWSFIIGFCVFLALWTIGNTYFLLARAFDPYPFIFLNLILSMVAAIQAPVIMMSQNRQATRDRLEAAKDYEVNLKAELEVLSLHQKIDLQVIRELSELRQQVEKLSAALDTTRRL